MNKKIIVLFFLFNLVVTTMAQMQQGYVKSIGRPSKPGVGLKNVEVRVDGNVNTVLSDDTGNFSFPVKGLKFQFRRINLHGYELADNDLLHFPFGYTPNIPVTIAMVSKEELRNERDKIEERMRIKLQNQFEESNALLEAQLEEKRITENQFKEELLALHEKIENLDSLVYILADRYARTDYDNIDSNQIAINELIRQGELEQAQNLIMSKGSINQRMQTLSKLRQTMSVQQEELAEDLFYLSQIAKKNNQLDSAYYYLERRWETDTCNVMFLLDLTNSFSVYSFPEQDRDLRIKQQEEHLFRLLSLSKSPATLFDDLEVQIYIDLASFYEENHNEEKAIQYYSDALLCRQKRGMKNVSYELESIGDIYFKRQNYTQAVPYYKQALRCQERDGFSLSAVRLAYIYYKRGSFKKAINEYIEEEKLFIKSMHTENELFSDWNLTRLSMLQIFIGNTYYDMRKYNDAMKYFTKAIELLERKYEECHWSGDLLRILFCMRKLQDCYLENNLVSCIKTNADNAVAIAHKYVEQYSSSYSRLILSETLCQRAEANIACNQMGKAQEDLLESLKQAEDGNIYREKYSSIASNVYYLFAKIYAKGGNMEQALHAVEKAIDEDPSNESANYFRLQILKLGEGSKSLNNSSFRRRACMDLFNPDGFVIPELGYEAFNSKSIYIDSNGKKNYFHSIF